MEKQKFKRGNLVKVLAGHQICSSEGVKDISPENVGRLAIIEYSYAEKYGGSNVNSYSIIWCDNGTSLAWKKTNELEFVDEGGEHLFIEAKAKREKLRKQSTDINYIAEHLDKGDLSSDSIIFLFDLLGFPTSFNRNGEYFALFNDWTNLHPAFVHIKNSNTVEEANSIFTEDAILHLNVPKVWNAFHTKIQTA